MTSAIDSTFIWSSGRLLPVSMTPTPSIMMLVSPPPPMRVGSPVAPFVVTPGASEASAVKLRLAIGRFSTELVGIVNERSPLRACNERGFRLDDDRVGQAADLDGEDAHVRTVAGADGDPGLLGRLEPRHADLDGVAYPAAR